MGTGTATPVWWQWQSARTCNWQFLDYGFGQVTKDEQRALDELARIFRVRGRVIPMSPEPLDLEAEVIGLGEDPREVNSVRQVAVATTLGQVRRVKLHPANPPASEAATAAIREADLITMLGSWFSSVIPHVLVPGINSALKEATAPGPSFSTLYQSRGDQWYVDGAPHPHDATAQRTSMWTTF